MDVQVTNNINSMLKRLESNTKKAFETVVLDIQRTSSGASPVDTGFLEKNHFSIEYGADRWLGTVWFEAFNKGFDYADWTHEAHYNLGPNSLVKSGGSSRFAGHVAVGRKYLHRTVDQGEQAYNEHIKEAIIDSLN